MQFAHGGADQIEIERDIARMTRFVTQQDLRVMQTDIRQDEVRQTWIGRSAFGLLAPLAEVAQANISLH